MRAYTAKDLAYTHDAMGVVMAVTEAGESRVIHPPSKKIYLHNDGNSDVYVSFDKPAVVGDPSILVRANEVLHHPLIVQTERIHAICAAGQASTLRAIVCF